MMFWGWHNGTVGWFWPIVGGLIWLVLLGLFVVVIIRLLSGPRARDQSWTAQPRPDDPEEILRARFARGEIAPDEYEQRLETLRRTRPGPPPR
jgi:putative membrane protein